MVAQHRSSSPHLRSPLHAFAPWPDDPPGADRQPALTVIDGLVSVTQQAWGLAGAARGALQ
jgi:hypothetical protein